MALTFAERMAAMKASAGAASLAPKVSPLNLAEEPEAQPTSVSQSPSQPIASSAPVKKVFGKPAVSPIATELVEEPEPVKVNTGVSVGAVGNIILLANEANKIVPKDKTEGEQLVEGDLPMDAINIKQKIANLQDFDGISLRYEMDELKKLLKASPDACMFLLPEELGLCVRALRKMTDNKVAVDMGATKAKAKKDTTVKLSADELKAALDDL